MLKGKKTNIEQKTRIFKAYTKSVFLSNSEVWLDPNTKKQIKCF